MPPGHLGGGVGGGHGTWMTRMLRPVSCASCSLMCRVGLGVAAKAAFRVSSCLALMVVRGPRRLAPRFWSSFSLLPVSLSDTLALSESLASSWEGSWESGDRLGSLPVVAGREQTGSRLGWGGANTDRRGWAVGMTGGEERSEGEEEERKRRKKGEEKERGESEGRGERKG